MPYSIEKNIQMPPARLGHKSSELRDTLTMMEIGDSFYIEKPQKAVGTYFTKQKPKKFATRKEKTGIRIWRVE